MKKQQKRKLVKLSSGDFWQPEKVGQVFDGLIVGRRVGETKYGSKPFVEICNEHSGETISLITTNQKLRRINCLPIGAYVQLVYKGEIQALIGGRKKKVNDIEAFTYDNIVMSDDWTKGEYYGKKNASQKIVKKRKR